MERETMIELEKKEKEMIQALFTDFLRERERTILSGCASARCFPQARWPSRPRNSAENRPSIKIWMRLSDGAYGYGL